jgi:hypothetical protein
MGCWSPFAALLDDRWIDVGGCYSLILDSFGCLPWFDVSLESELVVLAERSSLTPRMGFPYRSFGLATPASRDFWRPAYLWPFLSRSKTPAEPFQLPTICSNLVQPGPDRGSPSPTPRRLKLREAMSGVL